jgi:hypothetical protein
LARAHGSVLREGRDGAVREWKLQALPPRGFCNPRKNGKCCCIEFRNAEPVFRTLWWRYRYLPQRDDMLLEELPYRQDGVQMLP